MAPSACASVVISLALKELAVCGARRSRVSTRALEQQSGAGRRAQIDFSCRRPRCRRHQRTGPPDRAEPPPCPSWGWARAGLAAAQTRGRPASCRASRSVGWAERRLDGPAGSAHAQNLGVVVLKQARKVGMDLSGLAPALAVSEISETQTVLVPPADRLPRGRRGMR